MKQEPEKFQIELTMENGEITSVKPLTKDLNSYEPVPSLDRLPEKIRKELMFGMQHGIVMLTGQNSPGWVVIRTRYGYELVWRD